MSAATITHSRIALPTLERLYEGQGLPEFDLPSELAEGALVPTSEPGAARLRGRVPRAATVLTVGPDTSLDPAAALERVHHIERLAGSTLTCEIRSEQLHDVGAVNYGRAHYYYTDEYNKNGLWDWERKVIDRDFAGELRVPSGQTIFAASAAS